MVIVVIIPSFQHKNIFFSDADLLAISFDPASKWGYHLRVGELVVDSWCDPPLLEPQNFL